MCKSNLVEGLEGASCKDSCVLEVIGTATPPAARFISIREGKAPRKSFKFDNGCPSSPGEWNK